MKCNLNAKVLTYLDSLMFYSGNEKIIVKKGLIIIDLSAAEEYLLDFPCFFF